MNKPFTHRPVIFDYRAISPYVKDMLAWLKFTQKGFSVRKETRGLRRCSHSLVSYVAQGKRPLSSDRVADFAKVLRLNSEERNYLNRWICLESGIDDSGAFSTKEAFKRNLPRQKDNTILSDWLNIYVKDLCRIKGFQPKALIVHRLLGGLGSLKRIQRSLDFLFREGYLRKTLDGKIVENEVLVTTTDEKRDLKLQSLHRAALQIARRSIKIYPLSKRRESLVVLPLNETSLNELKELLKDFYEKVLLFAEEHPEDNQQLYQVIINLSPIGGKSREA